MPYAQDETRAEHAPPSESHIAASLAFGSLDKATDEQNGDTVFRDATLIAEGTWTDGHSRQATHYGGNELEKMQFEKMTMKMDHDIFGTLPLTNEIGVIENTRFVRDPAARWLGDVRIYPTQNGRDTATLLKRGQITDISSELFLKPVMNSKTRTSQATDMVFMGAATVRKGACDVCKFNGGINMTDEQNPVVTGGTEPETAATGDPDIAALEAQIKERELVQSSQTQAELALAHEKIAEQEKTIAELTARLTVIEKDTRVKELQQKLEMLSKQPVIHTAVSGAPQAAPQAVELDTGDFGAYEASDFSED